MQQTAEAFAVSQVLKAGLGAQGPSMSDLAILRQSKTICPDANPARVELRGSVGSGCILF